MGREAICHCRWGSTSGEVTAMLEATELILRRPSLNGPKRRRIPVAGMLNIRVEGATEDRLAFEFEQQTVSLGLGAVEAKKWAAAIRKPAPTLPQRLGIKPTTALRVLGRIDDANLETALGTAVRAGKQRADLVVARVDTPEDLMTVLAQTQALTVPLWVVYPKGAGQAISEAHVRETMRALNMIDNKVTSVSARLTALRFHPRSA